jgi:hypothetical protein
MAASQIPDLRTLLGTRGRGRGRGRGGRISGNGPPDRQAAALNTDEIIRGTDLTALDARMSAANVGLIEDAYSQYLAPQGHSVPRQMPIINRGELLLLV